MSISQLIIVCFLCVLSFFNLLCLIVVLRRIKTNEMISSKYIMDIYSVLEALSEEAKTLGESIKERR